MTTNKNEPEKLELIQLEGDPPTSNSRQQLGDLLYEEICYALKEGFIGEIRVSPPNECRLSDEDEDCCCESWAGFYSRYDYRPFGSIYLELDGSISVSVGNEFLGGNVHQVNSAGTYSLREDDLPGPDLGICATDITVDNARRLVPQLLAEEFYWHVPELPHAWTEFDVDWYWSKD